MKYGVIGESLKHSFSKEIHSLLADYEYELCEVFSDALDSFLCKRDFSAINVTIPYKEKIIPYLDGVDEAAREIGAVNTVVNRNGRLFGYNTDFYGMTMLIKHAAITLADKKVIILGSGGTSRTAHAVARVLGAREIFKVSRSAKDGAITYGELYERHTDADVIINTTPVGTYPNIFDTPIDLFPFQNLSGVIDVVYNPLKTPLILAARERGIPAEGGLYMLVVQAVRASEIFTDTKYPESTLDGIYEKILTEKSNIVLIGMPGSGKSTVGKLLADECHKEFIDTDELIEKEAGKAVSEIFAECGEAFFRDKEAEVVRKVSLKGGAVISTGGGVPLRKESVEALKENGKIYFIDRPLGAIIPTSDRPLAKTREEIEKRYNERYAIYTAAADAVIDADTDVRGVADKIKGDFK